MIHIKNKFYNIEPLKNKNWEYILNQVCHLMAFLKCNYWFSYGTSLGLYRDNKLIDNDTDIDIDLVGNSLIGSIQEIFKFDYDLIRTTTDTEDNFIYQLAFNHKESNIIVDFTFHKIVDNKLYSEHEFSGVVKQPIEFLDKIVWIAPFIPKNYNCYPVIEPEEYLNFVYGKDWKTPKNKEETQYNWGQDV